MLACHRALRLHTTHNIRVITSSVNVRSPCHPRSLRGRLCCTAETSSQSVRELASDLHQLPTETSAVETTVTSDAAVSRGTGKNRRNGSNRSAAAAAPTTVAQSGPAAAEGKLPEVLSATFPETCPTLSAARRGKQVNPLHGPLLLCPASSRHMASLLSATCLHLLTFSCSYRCTTCCCCCCCC
jgi:hypothetical protein